MGNLNICIIHVCTTKLNMRFQKLLMLIFISILDTGQLKDVCDTSGQSVCNTYLKTIDSVREYKYGGDIHFSCEVLNKTRIDSSKLFLLHKRSQNRIPFTNVTRNTGFADVKVVTKETGGLYSCRYGDCVNDSLLSTLDVKIDNCSFHRQNCTEVPQMTCRVNDLYNMTCDWTVPPFDGGFTKWRAMYKSEEMDTYTCCTADGDENCTSSNTRRQCYIPDSDFFRFILYNITLSEISEQGNNLYHYTVMPDDTIESVNIDNNVQVKPGETPYQLVVGFTLHHPPDSVGDMKCNISYKSEEDYSIAMTSTYNMCQTSLDVNITLHQLLPFTLYTVNVSCRPQLSPYWSNHVTGFGRTSPVDIAESISANKMDKGQVIAIAAVCSVIACLLIFVFILFFRKRIRNIIQKNRIPDEIITRILQDSPDNMPTQNDILSKSSESSGIYSICSSLPDDGDNERSDKTNAKTRLGHGVQSNQLVRLTMPKTETHTPVLTSDISKSTPDDYLIPAANSMKNLNEDHGPSHTGYEMVAGQSSTAPSNTMADEYLKAFDRPRYVSQPISEAENVTDAEENTNVYNPSNEAYEQIPGHLASDSDNLSVGEYNKAVLLPSATSASSLSDGYLVAHAQSVSTSSIPATWNTFDTDDEISTASNSQFYNSVDAQHRNAALLQTTCSCEEYMEAGLHEDMNCGLTSVAERAETASISNTTRDDSTASCDMRSSSSEKLFSLDIVGSSGATSGATVYSNELFDEYHKAGNLRHTIDDEVPVLTSTETGVSVDRRDEEMSEAAAIVNHTDDEDDDDTSEIDTTSSFSSGKEHILNNGIDVEMVENCFNDSSIQNSVVSGITNDRSGCLQKDENNKLLLSMKDMRKALENIGHILECDEGNETGGSFDSYALAGIANQTESTFNDTDADLECNMEGYVTNSST